MCTEVVDSSSKCNNCLRLRPEWFSKYEFDYIGTVHDCYLVRIDNSSDVQILVIVRENYDFGEYF